MRTCKNLEQEIREALTHLYDPDYQPSAALFALIDCPQGSVSVFQGKIIQMIEALEPVASTPSTAASRQAYEILYNRYVLGLTQEETAARLLMSRSSVQRAQRTALHILAQVALAQHAQDKGIAGGAQVSAQCSFRVEPQDMQAQDWPSQAKLELASVQAHDPNTLSDAAEAISDVLELTRVVTSRRDVRVDVGFVQPRLMVAIHPSVLRQMLITALERLTRYVPGGYLTIDAGLENGDVRFTVMGTLTSQELPSERDFVRDILVPEGASIQLQTRDDHVFLSVTLPSSGKVSVLVVDDNPDIARLYRRYTDGTSYSIFHTTEGKKLFQIVPTVAPDIIVLDVMLPDINGFSLLTRLREDPGTRSIPVVVCTVVKEEEIALSLGAARYLQKPVRPREFTQVLDEVLSRASTGSTRLLANNATGR